MLRGLSGRGVLRIKRVCQECSITTFIALMTQRILCEIQRTAGQPSQLSACLKLTVIDHPPPRHTSHQGRDSVCIAVGQGAESTATAGVGSVGTGEEDGGQGA